MKPRKLTTPNGRSVKAHSGREWENKVAQFFQDHGWPNTQRNGTIYGKHDRGDISGIPCTVQCKSVARVQMWDHLNDALVQAINNGTGDKTIVVYKRHGKSCPSQGAWVLPGSFAMQLLKAYFSEK